MYPDADVREIVEMVNAVIYRIKCVLKCNAALDRLLDKSRYPDLARKIEAVRKQGAAIYFREQQGLKNLGMDAHVVSPLSAGFVDVAVPIVCNVLGLIPVPSIYET
jgi:hypothetical protein